MSKHNNKRSFDAAVELTNSAIARGISIEPDDLTEFIEKIFNRLVRLEDAAMTEKCISKDV